MEPDQIPDVHAETALALSTLRELGISSIVVVDDTSDNLAAAECLRNQIERCGLKFQTYSGVEEFKTGFPQLERTGHTLLVTDLQMPCEGTVFGHKDWGGIEVINAALMVEAPERINFPVVISHGGQGHDGTVVHLCFGNDQKQIGSFQQGKAEPKFWEEAISLISQQVTRGPAKELWDIRVMVNRSNPFAPSMLIEENMKFGYIPFELFSKRDK